MTNFIQWTDQAFRELESLPEKLAFDIIRKTDLLSSFPELGSDFGRRIQQLAGIRQLVIDRRWRVIYEFDDSKSTVFILAVQSCRQKLPTKRKMRSRRDIA